MDCAWVLKGENLLPAGHCFSQTSCTCVIEVDLISSSPVSWLNCITVYQMFFILIKFNLTCSTCLCKPFLNLICWRMWEWKDYGTLETVHDRCLVLVLKIFLQTSSTFQHLSWSEPKRDIYHPSEHYHRASVCVWLSGLRPNTWQPSSLTIRRHAIVAENK